MYYILDTCPNVSWINLGTQYIGFLDDISMTGNPSWRK
jgi:hypothetical protein